jgi:hypothetical protein
MIPRRAVPASTGIIAETVAGRQHALTEIGAAPAPILFAAVMNPSC